MHLEEIIEEGHGFWQFNAQDNERLGNLVAFYTGFGNEIAFTLTACASGEKDLSTYLVKCMREKCIGSLV